MNPLEPGDYIDNYKISKVLHSGAMGHVYKAADMLSNQTVAVKAPFGDILNHPILYYHFQNEERIGRLMNHPRVVAFSDHRRSGQYLTLEYIPGRDLRSVFNVGQKLSFAMARRFTLRIAEGLAYLHAQGVIHLDIKPENVMVTPEEHLKIIDFGLARILGAVDLLTEDFMAPQGTPFYIAPEQLLGCRDDLRSDIYSLGTVFYEMLCGRLPFKRSKRLSAVRRRLKIDPAPPQRYNPAISPQVQEIVLKSLARDPANRYQSIAALIKDLTCYDKITLETPRRYRLLWQVMFNKPIRREKARATVKETCQPPQILGAIIDHDSADQVVATVKRQAILHGWDITLLTVSVEDTDSELTDFQTAVEGERLHRRIHKYVTWLRSYNLDPIVRIKNGDAAREIVGLAKKISADLIILGAPRKKGLKKLFGGRVIDRVIKKAPCNVVVAETTPAGAPLLDGAVDMTSARLLEIDLFLLDSWVIHLNWLSELTQTLLRAPHSHPDLDEHHCALGKWIDYLKADPDWSFIITQIAVPHKAFHDISRDMAVLAQAGDLARMRQVYFKQALPLSIRIRKGLQMASTALREYAACKDAGLSALFKAGTDASDKREMPSGPEEAKIRRIRDYFWRYPDGSPETCLLTINSEPV